MGGALDGARLWRRLFDAANAGGRLLGRLGLRVGEMDPGSLVDEARARTGLADFGEPDVREPLRRLVRAYRDEADLTPLGRIAARADLVRLLANRLRLLDDRRRRPALADEPIRRPIFIVSLPRTGTTLLHGLLAQDPASRAPRTWEVMYPSPPPGADGRRDDDRVETVRRQLRWFHRMAPDYRVAHPVGPRLPQECIAITEHAFESPRFHRTHHLPGYRAWLDQRDREEAYRFHRRFLQHLQHRTAGRRWILKSPPHTFWIDTLHRVYPDARFVQTHRDPLTVMASFASHTARLRSAFTDRPDTVDADRLARRWARGLEGLMAFRDREDVGDDRFVDVHYPDLVRRPLREVRRIYRRFGLSLEDRTRDRMRRFLAEHPKDLHGVHRYSLAEWNLDPDAHGPLFEGYRRRYDVEVWREDREKAWPA